MRKSRRPRHFHLGVRLEAAERIRAGRTTIEACARELGLEPEVVREWVTRHRDDRFESIRGIAEGSERFALQRRVKRLRECLAAAEREVDRLHKELIAALV